MKSLFTFKSIKSKLIFISIFILIIPMAIIGFLSYDKGTSNLNDLGKVNLKNSVKHTIELIDVLNTQVENGQMTLDEAQEEVRIAILGEMQEDGTRPINTNYDLGKNGYLFVYDQEGNEVAHPSLEGQNVWETTDSSGHKFVQTTIEKGNNGGGFTYYEWTLPNHEDQIEEKVVYSETDPHWNWVVSAGTYLKDFNSTANSILLFMAIVGGLSVVIGVIVIWLFANHISKPIKTVKLQMEGLANGNLSLEPIKLKSKDEFAQLANGLNLLQASFKEMINNIANASKLITNHSDELNQSANEVKSGSEQVAVTMQELASGAELQANNSSELASAMSSFTSKVESTNENSKHVYESSDTVLELTNEGRTLMAQSVQQMKTIDHIVLDAVEKVQGLDTQSREISKLVSVIKDIADQTNLLALNAAIEAARAGEQGRGFAVVADEVRKLAEQVGHSVSDITRIVATIQNETTTVVDSLQNGYTEVEKGTVQISTTGETFGKISTAVSEMANSIQAVTTTMSTIAAGSQKMNASIEEIASISEESAAGIEQTSASAQQTSSSMEEVAVRSNELARLAEQLTILVGQFKL